MLTYIDKNIKTFSVYNLEQLPGYVNGIVTDCFNVIQNIQTFLETVPGSKKTVKNWKDIGRIVLTFKIQGFKPQTLSGNTVKKDDYLLVAFGHIVWPSNQLIDQHLCISEEKLQHRQYFKTMLKILHRFNKLLAFWRMNRFPTQPIRKPTFSNQFAVFDQSRSPRPVGSNR